MAHKSKFPPYDQAVRQALDLQLKSSKAYLAWHKKTKCKYLPRYPHRAYAKEWVSWNVWLGTNNEFNTIKLNVRPLWEAVKWANAFATQHNLNTMSDWLAYCHAHPSELPEDIPVHPDNRYAEWDSLGWKGWLGTDIRKKIETARHSTALVALCGYNSIAKPGNLYVVVIAETGEVELRQKLNAIKSVNLIRVYRLGEGDKEYCMETIQRHGTPGDGGVLIPMIGNLLFDLDMNLMKANLQPLAVEVKSFDVNTLFGDGVHTNRVG
jgi:hypothetical protein